MTKSELSLIKSSYPHVYSQLTDVDGMTDREILDSTPTELFDAWLRWNGIIGYTHQIAEMAKCLLR